MKLSDITCDQVSSTIRSRGKMYADLNSAKIIAVNDSKIEANVAGSNFNSYKVNIFMADDDAIVDCTCPYFQSSGVCKHIWATILTAEKNGFESRYVTDETILVERDLYNDDDDDDDEDELDDDDEFLQELENPGLGKLKESLYRDNGKLVQKTGYKNLCQFTKKGSTLSKPSPDWKALFSISSSRPSNSSSARKSLEGRIVFFEIEESSIVGLNGLQITVLIRKIKQDGELGQQSNFELLSGAIEQLADSTDRQICTILLGACNYNYSRYSTTRLNKQMADVVLPMIIQTGRCYFKSRQSGEKTLLSCDFSTKWELTLSLEEMDQGYQLKPSFTFNDNTQNLADVLHINNTGYIFWKNGVVNPFDAHQLYSWISNLAGEAYTIPSKDIKEFILNFKGLKDKPILSYPEEHDIPEIKIEPKPLLRILGENDMRRTLMFAELNFLYDQHVFKYGDQNNTIYDADQNVVYIVNHTFHSTCLNHLFDLGLKEDTWYSYESLLNFRENQFIKIVTSLLNQGWQVEGKNVHFKKPGKFSISVNSGIDWFEVQGTCEYEGETITIPEILDAIKKKKEFIELSNGELGLLPTEWLEKYGKLVSMGTVEDDSIRFKKSQTLLVDLLLSEMPEVHCDEIFTSIRNSLRSFTGISLEKECDTFSGTLRNYQREGLGWLSFLKLFGFGGCLADDMGLGKTIQVLAMLEKVRNSAAESLKTGKPVKKAAKKSVKIPSLVVTPRSLVYNWNNEATKFTPKLKVLDHSHSLRTTLKPDFTKYDLVLVTYGTLIRDIEFLRTIQFNYIILDEAQTIKNSNTVTSKSARLLNGTNRLALSGTPVENHLGDLWSIFEFLNPGILGSASVFKGTAGSKKIDESQCELLRKALRPFILRRTKSQVATDLPEKTEELIICEMEPDQKKIYDQLKKYYQESLKKKIRQSGLNRSKIQILEALLRLRQVTCHPGLVDNKYSCMTSAKLETLNAQILELKEECHKCLVFSQFTSMLAIIRNKLDESGVRHEYLDGSTRNRQQVIDRFQNDPDCTVFLISLKAGGVGLNLTSAEYVFIFDPWWNPAAEMQAIDRTHRIGQNKPVFAYRLICKGTVEEKIIELQKNKRLLAESVITTDESVLSSITQEELELLLE